MCIFFLYSVGFGPPSLFIAAYLDLFSNTVAPALVGASLAAFDRIMHSTELLENLQTNTKHFRKRMSEAQFILGVSSRITTQSPPTTSTLPPTKPPLCVLLIDDCRDPRTIRLCLSCWGMRSWQPTSLTRC